MSATRRTGRGARARQRAGQPDQRERPATPRGARYLWEMEQARRRAVRDIVEQRIQEAREEGKFDNLKGKGQPLAWTRMSGRATKRWPITCSRATMSPRRSWSAATRSTSEIDRAEGRCGRCDIGATRCARERCSPATAAPTTPARRHRAPLRRGAARDQQQDLSLNIIAPPALHRRPLAWSGGSPPSVRSFRAWRMRQRVARPDERQERANLGRAG